jgi:peroxiredoxin (alkyl hydroperoxide reductase subunit C)
MDRRLLMVLLAAVTIGGLIAYKLTRTYPDVPLAEDGAEGSYAPLIDTFDPQGHIYVYDHNSRAVRLSRYAGRHKLLVVFYQAPDGADHSPQVMGLREHYAELRRTGAEILAISPTQAPFNRKAIERVGKFPFVLLSDPAHMQFRQWGLYDTESQRALNGTFVVDRAGIIRFARRGGEPYDDYAELVKQLEQVR